MKNKIGIMQGRLVPPVGNAIQAFPKDNWQEEFPAAHELELDCIEFIFDGDDISGHPLMTAHGLQEIKKLEAASNIRVLSVCADFFMARPIHRGDSRTRNNATGLLKELVNNCSKLDVTDIVIPCVDNSRLRNPKEVLAFESGIRECLKTAGDCGISLALETDLGPEEFVRLVGNIDNDYIKINYDSGNSASLGYDPVTEIQSYGRWITDTHIKDRVLGGGTVPLGTGDVNFSAVFDSLFKIGYRGIFILQTARGPAGREKETIKGYLDFIAKYLKRGV